MIVEREEEIERFVAQEYWRLTAMCTHENSAFEARLTQFSDQKIQHFSMRMGRTPTKSEIRSLKRQMVF